MNEWWLKFLANYGQLAAGAFALIAACIGLFASYASNQLTKKSDAELVKASAIIARHERQVGMVIGGDWKPLSPSQQNELSKSVSTLPKPKHQIQVMYENEFGKELAESIAVALRAAGWKVEFSTGSGFGKGIEAGPSWVGPALRERLSTIMGRTDIRSRGEEAQDMGAWFIGVGAKVDHE